MNTEELKREMYEDMKEEAAHEQKMRDDFDYFVENAICDELEEIRELLLIIYKKASKYGHGIEYKKDVMELL